MRRDVDKFCADNAVRWLPDGFYMVVMDDIRENYVDLLSFIISHWEISSNEPYTHL